MQTGSHSKNRENNRPKERYMTVSKKEKKGTAKVKIKKAITVYETVELHSQLRENIEKNDSVELDLSAVTDCDTAGVQLIYSAVKTAKNNGTILNVVNASGAVLTAVNRTGFDPEEIFN